MQVASQFMYATLWKLSGIAPSIGEATSVALLQEPHRTGADDCRRDRFDQRLFRGPALPHGAGSLAPVTSPGSLPTT